MIAEIADVYGVTTDYIIKGTNMSENTDAPTDIALKFPNWFSTFRHKIRKTALFMANR